MLKLKDKTLSQIEKAAQKGETDNVIASSQRLKKIDSLLHRLEDLDKDVEKLTDSQHLKNGFQAEKATIVFKPENPSGSELSARKKGKLRRRKFLKNLEKEGINLKHIRGSLYKAPSDLAVGIAYASERQDDRWFLGLPAEKFDNAFLLCESNNGHIAAIFLPESFFRNYGSSLSRAGGQIKFNVSRKEDEYYLVVPGEGNINTSQYQDKFDSLK